MKAVTVDDVEIALPAVACNECSDSLPENAVPVRLSDGSLTFAEAVPVRAQTADASLEFAPPVAATAVTTAQGQAVCPLPPQQVFRGGEGVAQ